MLLIHKLGMSYTYIITVLKPKCQRIDIIALIACHKNLYNPFFLRKIITLILHNRKALSLGAS